MSKKIVYTTEVKESRDKYLEIILKTKKETKNALEKWTIASIKEVNSATNIAEAKAAFRAAPWSTPAKIYALEKWASLCITIKDVKDAYKISWRRFSDKENPAYAIWIELSYHKAKEAINFSDLANVFWNMPEPDWFVDKKNAKIYKEIFSKLLNFCHTPDDLDRISVNRLRDRDLKNLYYEKLKEVGM